MNCDDYGAFGLAWKTAPTLRDSFARAERYWRLLTTVSEYEVRTDGANAYFILHRDGERRLGMRLSNEATLASATSISRQVAPAGFHPKKIFFKHPRPAVITAHEAYFGCPVVFGSEMDAMLVAAESLDRPNRQADQAITRFLLNYLDEELQKVATSPTLQQQVRAAIAESLSEGVPKMRGVARGLGLSERTLQRRLGEEGVSFQQLVDSARRELAEGLLVQSDYSLSEIAFLSGFSEQSAFNRAFKRWVNQTPAAYRESSAIS